MQHLSIHPKDPSPRHVARVAAALGQGQLAVLPSAAGYLLAWSLDDRAGQERVMRLRRLDHRHRFTLLCKDLRQVGQLARLEDHAFRFLRAHIPGPYTFVLPASSQLPKRLLHSKQRTIGVRICGHPVLRAILEQYGHPLASSSLRLPTQQLEGLESDELAEALRPHVDLFLDCGYCGWDLSTVVDLCSGSPLTLRSGAGAIDWT